MFTPIASPPSGINNQSIPTARTCNIPWVTTERIMTKMTTRSMSGILNWCAIVNVENSPQNEGLENWKQVWKPDLGSPADLVTHSYALNTNKLQGSDKSQLDDAAVQCLSYIRQCTCHCKQVFHNLVAQHCVGRFQQSSALVAVCRTRSAYLGALQELDIPVTRSLDPSLPVLCPHGKVHSNLFLQNWLELSVP